MLRSSVAHVGEDRRGACVHDHVGGRGPRDRRRDHLVARADAERDAARGAARRCRRPRRARARPRGTRRTGSRAPPRAGRSSASRSEASPRRRRSPPRRSPGAGSRAWSLGVWSQTRASTSVSNRIVASARRRALERLLATFADGQHRARRGLRRGATPRSGGPAADRCGCRGSPPGAKASSMPVTSRSSPAAARGSGRTRRRRVPRRELRGVHRLAERSGERSAVQVDAERDAAELGVVPAAEARRELADTRPVRADEHLRVARARSRSRPPPPRPRRLDDGADLAPARARSARRA